MENILSISNLPIRKSCNIGSTKEVPKRKRQAQYKRSPKPRYKSPRFSQKGFMLQLDSSPHYWFNNEESCLIAAIDDATSEAMSGQFFLDQIHELGKF